MSVYSFSATITGELYYNFENYFGVYSFTSEDEIPHLEKKTNKPIGADFFTVKNPESYLAGQVQKLSIGSSYDIRAELKAHPKYGHQYVPLQVIMQKPRTKEDSKNFLISICTQNQAEKILTAYPDFIKLVSNGETTFNVPITDSKLTEIIEKVQENYLVSDIMGLLAPLGVTYKMIKKLLGDVPNPLLLKEILYENPYILTRIHGLGFKKIDEIALKLNQDLKVSENRLKAYLQYFSNETANGNGHTVFAQSELRIAVAQNVPETSRYLDPIIEDKEFMTQSGSLLGLTAYYKNESFIFKKITELASKCDVLPNLNHDITLTENTLKLVFTPEQKKAILSTTTSDFIIISGSAGTGKSTVIQGVLDMYEGKRIGICALAAKAAQRVTEITGFPASTIHRLLRWKGSGFEHDEYNPLPYDILIVDEASMINSWLFKKLLEAVRSENTKVIIVFDHAQLPPIGSGNVATDLLSYDKLKINKFTKIHRQAEKSGILLGANLIRQGQNPIKESTGTTTTGELNDMHYHFIGGSDKEKRKLDIQKEIIASFRRAVSIYGIDNVVVIVPRKQNVVNSTRVINEIIQDILFDQYVPSIRIGKRRLALGARVMQKVNNYEKDVINGETGYISQVDEQGRKFKIKFSETKTVELTYENVKSLELAYALTVHSYQGSQSDIVIIGLDFSHYVLLDNCLLYTAITRASKQCKIIAENNAFTYAIKQNKNRSRKTFLSRIISGNIDSFYSKNESTNDDKEQIQAELRNNLSINNNIHTEENDRTVDTTKQDITDDAPQKEKKRLI